MPRKRITLREFLCRLFGIGCPPPPPKKNIKADGGHIALKEGQSTPMREPPR